MTQKPFELRGHNPDILTCIANLSNDEVFTPPELANEMLDLVATGWAEANNGANIWANPTVTFLDPATKSGVFLREITARLVAGLADSIPNLQERVDHILTKQVFGIGITNLTALLARRSLYCSKVATSEHAITQKFQDPSGNIWFGQTEHTWGGGKKKTRTNRDGKIVEYRVGRRCSFCGAAESEYGRDATLETHAYAFIHTKDIKARVAELFGDTMKFDVIIGNPPYQLGSDGGTRDMPIYQKFVEQAKQLEPSFLSMVIPSRWMAGGLGLADFRATVLSDQQMTKLIDYPVASEVFPGVEIKGGICYFLWERGRESNCEVTTIRGDTVTGPVNRDLTEFDTFIRDSRALPILRKVVGRNEPSMADILSARTAFGLVSNYKEYRQKPRADDVRFYATSPTGRFIAWVSRDDATARRNLIDSWKAMIPKAGSDGGQKLPDYVLGQPWLAEPPSVCTQSFIFVAVENEHKALSILSYYSTRFLRFLVSLRKITQDTKADTYKWVPQQSWDRLWTDKMLYEKYDLTEDEIEFIESMIRPMDPPND